MEMQRFRLSTRLNYLCLYIACILLCVLNVFLNGFLAGRLPILLTFAYGIASYLLVRNVWKPNLVLLFYCTICALVVKWYHIDQNFALIIAQPFISLLFSVCTRTILNAFRSASRQENEIGRTPSWFQNNRIGFAFILSSNLIYFIWVAIDILFFECTSGLMYLYIFHLYPLTGLLLGVISCIKAKRFAGICAVFLGISVHIAFLPWLLWIFINGYYFYIGIFAVAFVIIGYILGMISGLITKICNRKRSKE